MISSKSICNNEGSKEKLKEGFEFLKKYFSRNLLEQAKGEFDIWCALWKGDVEKPSDAMSTLTRKVTKTRSL